MFAQVLLVEREIGNLRGNSSECYLIYTKCSFIFYYLILLYILFIFKKRSWIIYLIIWRTELNKQLDYIF